MPLEDGVELRPPPRARHVPYRTPILGPVLRDCREEHIQVQGRHAGVAVGPAVPVCHHEGGGGAQQQATALHPTTGLSVSRGHPKKSMATQRTRLPIWIQNTLMKIQRRGHNHCKSCDLSVECPTLPRRCGMIGFSLLDLGTI